MRLSLRFIIPLLLALAAIAYAVVPLADELTLRWFIRDLDSRSRLIANTIQEPLQELIQSSDKRGLLEFFGKITKGERLYAMGFCASPKSKLVVSTSNFPKEIRCLDIERFATPSENLLKSAHGPLYVSVKPIEAEGASGGKLILIHDMSFVERRSEETKKYLFYFFVGLGFTVSLITVIIAELSWRGWVQGLRALLRGEVLLRPSGQFHRPELRPIVRDLRQLIRDVQSEHGPRDGDHGVWTSESLQSILKSELRGQEVLVVSNREPYIHVYRSEAVEYQRPASGLVTALEPIMRACSGTWIAHGSGAADREVVDKHDRVEVPPKNPAYRIRRIWLSAEEETGYYFGFSNEGIWPLCHIAHVRPVFRSSDWEQYVKVNRKFARAVKEEASSHAPLVLVQDYHLALLPRMIQESLPGAIIVTFWHIPWPNPEAFTICPWREELLDGLLGSSILGFHTQFHCNNFVDTVDRLLEARVDREMFSVSYLGNLTAVKRYPISIEWPLPPSLASVPAKQCRDAVRHRHNLPPDHAVGIGVDRLDYTKGIEERLRAVERLLEMQPQWVGKFTFIQIAAPTRSLIEQYQAYEVRVRAMAGRINTRFALGEHPPIVLKVEHHEPQDVYEYYRGADVCFVSSLHDGMNLVAKEFVASRDDERGVLILSQFTGASRELPEALIVNPYDADQCAAALHLALSMPEGEQRDRMRLMRGLIQEFNVYRWAGRMLIDAALIRRRGRLRERTVKMDSQLP
ncbi:MAG: trehalose-6-phosphate synthase [Thermodesulfobacteriota bacterium]